MRHVHHVVRDDDGNIALLAFETPADKKAFMRLACWERGLSSILWDVRGSFADLSAADEAVVAAAAALIRAHDADPLPVDASPDDEPEPVVDQLVRDLVAAPGAPQRRGAPLLAA